MNDFIIRQIKPEEYNIVRQLDRDAFGYNERGSDGEFHAVLADNIRRSPYFIPELDLVAIRKDGFILGHGIFSSLPMGDAGKHVIWLHSLAVRHGENDNHDVKSYEYQRKGIGTALVMCELKIAKFLGYTGCMTCGNPAVYKNKMGFSGCSDFGISWDDSVEDPESFVFAIELVQSGFDKTNKLLSYSYYDFTKTEQVQIKAETLTCILSKILGKTILRADYQTKELQGGTLGEVRLVTGMVETIDGKILPYKVVLKIQKKWIRPGDPDSWRKEYDLYGSDFEKFFTDSFRWPECYHAEMNDDEIQIWMEYIDGISGNDLTIEMLEQAALELGRYQGRLYKQSESLHHIVCLGDAGFLAREFSQWHTQSFTYDFLISEPCRMPGFLKQMLINDEIQLVEGKSFEYGYLRSRSCDIPEHLKQMLIDIDDHKDEIFDKLKNLPVVLCHRDFWNENIFFSDGRIRIIDWDTTGWGFLGEDIASLIVDGMDVARFEENYHRLIPTYLKGISEYMDISSLEEMYILEMILVKFGYRMMQEYMFSESPEEKSWGMNALQKIYELWGA
jgi:predicted N-acetyltransferase YhbS